MLRAANQLIRSTDGTPLIYRASDWELLTIRANGNFGTKSMYLNETQKQGTILVHDEPQAYIIAPGDSVYSDINTSAFTLNYTANMVWPNEVVGGRKMASRSDFISLTLGTTKTIVESKDQWYEVTCITGTGASAYRIAVGDKRGLQYCEPPPGKQWRFIVGPGDYVSLIGGGTVDVGVTVTELPPFDRLVKKAMDKIRSL